MLRRLAQIPLDVADQPRAVVQHAQALRRVPRAPAVRHPTAARVEVEVPQAVYGDGLEAPCLPLLQPLRRATLPLRLDPLALRPAPALHRPAHRGVRRRRAVLLRRLVAKRHEVVVVQLVRPTPMRRVLRPERVEQRRAEGCRPAHVAALRLQQRGQRIDGVPRLVVPGLDRGEAEAHRLAVGVGVEPLGEGAEHRSQLSVRRRAGEQRGDHRQAYAGLAPGSGELGAVGHEGLQGLDEPGRQV